MKRPAGFRVLLLVAAAAASIAACGGTGHVTVSPGLPERPSSPQRDVSLGRGNDQAPIPLAAGRTLHAVERRHTLAAPALSPLSGWSSPIVVPAPDGGALAYTTWEHLRDVDPFESFGQQGIATGDPLAVPSIRLVTFGDAITDELLLRGGYSVAWRSDGAFAYVRGEQEEYRANTPYDGYIEVAQKPRGSTVRWVSSPARYTVVAWAGEHLLAYRETGPSDGDVIAISAPEQLHSLGSGAVVAVSDDGSTVALSSGVDATLELRIVSVADAATLFVLEAETLSNAGLKSIGYAGDWVGTRLVARGFTRDDIPVIAMFEASSSGIRIEDILRFPVDDVPVGFQEVALRNGGTDVFATYMIPPPLTERGYDGSAVDRHVNCRRDTADCVWGDPEGEGALFQVRNDSRPLPEAARKGWER